MNLGRLLPHAKEQQSRIEALAQDLLGVKSALSDLVSVKVSTLSHVGFWTLMGNRDQPRPISDSLALLADCLDVLLPEEQLLGECMRNEKERIDTEIERLEARVIELQNEIQALDTDTEASEYELSAVFMHRGETMCHAYGPVRSILTTAFRFCRTSWVWVSVQTANRAVVSFLTAASSQTLLALPAQTSREA